MPIYHFLYYGYEKTVIDSQVITPALLLDHDGVSVRLISMEDWGKRKHPLFGWSMPRVPRNFLYLNTVSLFFFFLKHAFSRQNIVVHTRGLQGSAVLLPLKRVFRRLKVICDVRGLEADEYEFNVEHEGKLKQLNVLQRFWKHHLEKNNIKFHSKI